VSVDRKRLTTAVAALAGIAIAGLTMAPLLVKGISPVASGVILGVVGVICLGGVAFGIWDARRIEARRKAKEDIWIKH
jgi:hypothetical protein